MLKLSILTCYIEKLANTYEGFINDMTGHYVIDYDNKVFYGPFKDEKKALRANYFFKSVDERDKAANKSDWISLFYHDVQFYEDDDIKTLIKYPEELGQSLGIVIKPANEVPINSQWNDFPQDFREERFEKDARLLNWKRP